MTEPERPADPEEQRAAAALAEALDRGDLPGDAADADAVDAAALLTAHDRFELSADRMDAVAARIAARVAAQTLAVEPRRRWRWLWIAAPTLAAAAALALVVLPANAPREAAEPAPSAASVEPNIAPAPDAPASDGPAPSAALIALQQRMISGDATAEADYRVAMARHRARLLGPGWGGP